MKLRCRKCGKKKKARKLLFHSKHRYAGSICKKCELKS